MSHIAHLSNNSQNSNQISFYLCQPKIYNPFLLFKTYVHWCHSISLALNQSINSSGFIIVAISNSKSNDSILFTTTNTLSPTNDVFSYLMAIDKSNLSSCVCELEIITCVLRCLSEHRNKIQKLIKHFFLLKMVL